MSAWQDYKGKEVFLRAGGNRLMDYIWDLSRNGDYLLNRIWAGKERAVGIWEYGGGAG